MFSVPAPLHQRLVGSSLCPAPTQTPTEVLADRVRSSSLRSTVSGLVLGAALATGFLAEKPVTRVFSALAVAAASGVLARENMRRRTNMFVLENRARLGNQSVYRYEGL